MREDRSLLDLIGADSRYLNETLARHYGIADTAGNWQGQPANATRGPADQRAGTSSACRSKGKPAAAC